LALKMTTQSAGRSAEVAWLTVESLRWDRHLRICPGVIPQSKTSKPKMAAFLAGVDRHHCFFIDLGDHLALEDRPVYDPDQPFAAFPRPATEGACKPPKQMVLQLCDHEYTREAVGCVCLNQSRLTNLKHPTTCLSLAGEAWPAAGCVHQGGVVHDVKIQLKPVLKGTGFSD
jgi:hypothetical protein